MNYKNCTHPTPTMPLLLDIPVCITYPSLVCIYSISPTVNYSSYERSVLHDAHNLISQIKLYLHNDDDNLHLHCPFFQSY